MIPLIPHSVVLRPPVRRPLRVTLQPSIVSKTETVEVIKGLM